MIGTHIESTMSRRIYQDDYLYIMCGETHTGDGGNPPALITTTVSGRISILQTRYKTVVVYNIVVKY